MNTIKFKSKALGFIGSVVWNRAADGSFIVDGTPLKNGALEYLVNMGLKQSLADSYVFTKEKPITLGTAQERFGKKLEGIIAGTVTMGERESDPIEKEVKRLARITVAAAVGTLAADRNTPAKMDDVLGKGTFAKLVAKYLSNEETAAIVRVQAVANLAANKALADVSDLFGDLEPGSDDSADDDGEEDGEEEENGNDSEE